MISKRFSLNYLADLIEAKLIGNGAIEIDGIAPIETAQSNQLSFIDNPKYRKHLSATNAGAVIMNAQVADGFAGNALVMANPYLGYAKVSTLFVAEDDIWRGIDQTAFVAEDAIIEDGVTIASRAVVESKAHIKSGAYIGPGCVVGARSSIGKRTCLFANVTLYSDTIIGDDGLIHAGVVIGGDGFGFAKSSQGWVKVPQHGRVVIGNDVEIGANTTIDRGALADTEIGNGVKLDNQIQVGHNVVIGDHTIIAGCTAIAGSVQIGKHCMIAGAVSIAGHLSIADGVVITGMTGVGSNIDKAGIYSSGLLHDNHSSWLRNAVAFKQLYSLSHRVKKLESSN